MAKSNDESFNKKIIIITGANTGIGFETAIDMARRGATVVLACRDRTRAEGALVRIKEESKSEKVFVEDLDLGDLSSVRDFAKRFKEKYNRLDILINNAGIMMCPYGKTKDGFETQFGVNHLGHFLLTNLLLDVLEKSAPSRIVNVSSLAHKRGEIRWNDLMWDKGYDPMGAYQQSKLANVLFTIELAKRLKDKNVTAVSLHPGIVKTELGRHFHGCMGCVVKCVLCCFPCILLAPEDGAKTTIYCATSPDIPKMNGSYFSDSKKQELSAKCSNDADATKLWEISAKLVNLE